MNKFRFYSLLIDVMNIKNQLENFALLRYEEKKTKVLAMLQPIKWKSKIFADLYARVTDLPDIPEAILTSIYQGILEVAQSIQQGNKAEEMANIKKISIVMETLHQQEKLEKEREGNPDDMLKSL